MIGSVRPLHEDRDGPRSRVAGDLYKFVDIDPGAQWLNLRTGRPAEDDQLRQIRIPPDLRPNLRTVPYVLFPQVHRLIFASALDPKNTLTPGLAQSLVEQCLNQPHLVERYGPVEVHVEPDREVLEQLLRMPRLKLLEMRVDSPNVLGPAERRLFEYMDRNNAERYEQTLRSTHPDGLRPDPEVRSIARVAQAHGVVNARGENEDGRVIELSTAERPLQERVIYDRNLTTARAALEERAQGLAGELAERPENADDEEA